MTGRDGAGKQKRPEHPLDERPVALAKFRTLTAEFYIFVTFFISTEVRLDCSKTLSLAIGALFRCDRFTLKGRVFRLTSVFDHPQDFVVNLRRAEPYRFQPLLPYEIFDNGMSPFEKNPVFQEE